MTNQPSRFFLQAIDPDHGCPVLEAIFYVDDVNALSTLIDAGTIADGKLSGYFDIETHELLAITKRFNVAFEPGDRAVRIQSWHSIRGAPYLIHTYYELMLMLDGRKKFARMDETYPPEQHYNESYFDKYVLAGVLHREVVLMPFSKPFKMKDGREVNGIREVYYTLIGEEWRIAAWKLIAKASQKAGWNESFERLEGMLFGYEEWQMDWWIARHKKPAPLQNLSDLPSLK